MVDSFHSNGSNKDELCATPDSTPATSLGTQWAHPQRPKSLNPLEGPGDIELWIKLPN